MNSSGTKIRDPDLKRLRAMKMLEMRVAGRTVEDIAREFDCHRNLVTQTIMWAKREGYIEEAEEAILQRLVPKAIQVYAKKLEEDDPFVAKDVLGHLMKLGDRVAARKEHVEEMSLTAYLKLRKDRNDETGTEAEGAGSTITITATALPEPEGPAGDSAAVDEGRLQAEPDSGPAD